MNKRELLAVQDVIGMIFSGIVSNNPFDEGGLDCDIVYNFECQEFEVLKEKYDLVKIAGKGSDFSKAKRLLHYLTPKLTHHGYYTNHINCNSLDLLEYSFDKPENGINCLNKSKILEECLLALGIYARRISMYPYSPFDMDNHVVTEVFDRKLNKWIMLDPTFDTYLVDINGTPLSLIEARILFGKNEFVTAVNSYKRNKDLKSVYNKNIQLNTYYKKNCFYFCILNTNGFGVNGKYIYFYPSSFNRKEQTIQNALYRLQYCKEHNLDENIVKSCLEYMDIVQSNDVEPIYDIEILTRKPF